MEKELKDDMLSMVVKELAYDSNMDDNTRIEIYKKVFNEIYAEQYRHEYSKITRVLFSIGNSEERDFLLEKLSMIKSSLEAGITQSGLNKLSDHIELENIRMVEFEKTSTRAIKASENINDVKAEVKLIEDKTEKAQNKLKSIQRNLKDNTVQSITILSIFAAVVITFSGGMSFIASAMSGIDKAGPYKLGVFIILIGLIMFNVIFLLLYMIGKLTNTYVGTGSCSCNKPSDSCNYKRVRCSIIRYPYVILINIIGILGIASFVALKFLEKFNILNLYSIIILMLILFIVIIVTVMLFKTKCENDDNDK